MKKYISLRKGESLEDYLEENVDCWSDSIKDEMFQLDLENGDEISIYEMTFKKVKTFKVTTTIKEIK